MTDYILIDRKINRDCGVDNKIVDSETSGDNGVVDTKVNAEAVLGIKVDISKDYVYDAADEQLEIYFNSKNNFFSDSFSREKYCDKSIDVLHDVYLNEEYVKYYIDSDKNLNVYTLVELPAGRGDFNEVLTLSK